MTHDPKLFANFFDYVVWADLRQLDSTRTLGEEAYFKEHGWSFGSVHKVMLHLLSAQRVWLDRFEHQPPVWLVNDSRMASRSAIEPEWRAVHDRGRKFIAAQTPESLAADLRYSNLRGQPLAFPVCELLMHLCNHAMHHRGQLNSMIRLSGGTPADVDYFIYARQKQGSS